jgi:deoxyribonuclease-4
MNNKSSPIWGAHVSIAKSIDLAFMRAENININAMQIFTKSNRQWQCKELKKEDIAQFLNAKKNSQIKYINAHAGYLINLASENTETVNKSKISLINEIEICEKLEIDHLVLHPGSNKNHQDNQPIKKTALLIKQVLDETKNVSILLENMAGQGGAICASIEQLAELIEKIDNSRVGVCIDTCHAFAFGYSMEELDKKITEHIGWDKIKLFHLNNSKKDLGSKVDRHEHLKLGKIIKEEIRYILNNSKFLHIPKILETPNDEESEYVQDLKFMAQNYNYQISDECPLHVYQSKSLVDL